MSTATSKQPSNWPTAVIDKNLLSKRDTLVLPILYNARHSVELALKFATRRLVRQVS